MADPKKFFDVWFVQKNNTVYKEVPFHVVTDWAQQARLSADDMLKPSGTANWFKLGTLPLFQAYLPQPNQTIGDPLEPIELDFNWKPHVPDDDDDVDMIPLIDISLVLLIFFMMTTTVASISRIAVPTMEDPVKIETGRDVLRIDIDMVNGAPLYAIGKGTAAPKDEDANLRDEAALVERLRNMVATYLDAPKARIAAHGDLPYEIVEQVMKELDRLRLQSQISEYSFEVNERAKR